MQVLQIFGRLNGFSRGHPYSETEGNSGKIKKNSEPKFVSKHFQTHTATKKFRKNRVFPELGVHYGSDVSTIKKVICFSRFPVRSIHAETL